MREYLHRWKEVKGEGGREREGGESIAVGEGSKMVNAREIECERNGKRGREGGEDSGEGCTLQ